jgi:hypothetical protein
MENKLFATTKDNYSSPYIANCSNDKDGLANDVASSQEKRMRRIQTAVVEKVIITFCQI